MDTGVKRGSLSVLFVADGARLEMQAWLLAASLARAHEGRPLPAFLAYVSPARMAELAPLTRDLFEACGVALRPLPDPPAWRRPYPHGNKIVAACDTRDTDRAVFLDTDTVCMGPLDALADLPPDTVAAAPEGVATWGGSDDRWPRAYAHFGLPVPETRVRLLRGRRREFVPYFNAGVLAFPDRAEPGFAARWLDTALDFDHNCRIGGKRPWLDQIALPLALARFGYRAHVLDESWNYSLSRRKSMEGAQAASILHYHRFRHLAAAPQWPELHADLMSRLPPRHHAALSAALSEAGLVPPV
jgi:hypothetical protein